LKSETPPNSNVLFSAVFENEASTPLFIPFLLYSLLRIDIAVAVYVSNVGAALQLDE
jgi:hypothetical protein